MDILIEKKTLLNKNRTLSDGSKTEKGGLKGGSETETGGLHYEPKAEKGGLHDVSWFPE